MENMVGSEWLCWKLHWKRTIGIRVFETIVCGFASLVQCRLHDHRPHRLCIVLTRVPFNDFVYLWSRMAKSESWSNITRGMSGSNQDSSQQSYITWVPMLLWMIWSKITIERVSSYQGSVELFWITSNYASNRGDMTKWYIRDEWFRQSCYSTMLSLLRT